MPTGIRGIATLAALALVLGLLSAVFRRLPNYIPAGVGRRLVVRWLTPSTDLAATVLALLVAVSFPASRASPMDAAIAALFLAGLAWVFRTTAEDFANGIVLRMEGAVEPDTWIAWQDVAGRIRHVGLRSLEVETEAGRRLQVPYTQIGRARIERAVRGTGASAGTFRIAVPRTVPLGRVLADVPARALLSPWCSSARPPEVRLLRETGEDYLIDVTVYAVDPAFVSEIEATVRVGLARLSEASLHQQH